MSEQTYVIIGGGQAGGEIGIELRKQQFAGKVIVVGEEPFIPYKRPPLSKAYLAGTATDESLYLMPKAGLDKANVEYRGGVAVTRIDRAAKKLEFADGNTLAYDKLALATGGRARPLNLVGANRPNVFLLRTIDDVKKIQPYRQPGKRVTIVGGGFIGLEVAAVLVKAGLKVTVLEGLPRVLARVTVPEVSAFFEKLHRDAGVDLRIGAQVEALEGEPNVTHVLLGDGSKVETDFVVVGIGLLPNVEIAQQAGLAVDNGIVVDEFTRTSDPDIVAAGDCTNHPNDFIGRRIRLESVQNAMEQARAAAHTMVGKPQAYHAVPWFWSDQYDVKLQMVGLSAGFDQHVMRGDTAKKSFALMYLRDGHLIAADTVGRPQDFMIAKKLVATRAKLDPAQLADETVPLKSFLPAA